MARLIFAKKCGLPTEFYDDGDEPCFIQYELKAQDGTVFARSAVQRDTRAGSGVISTNVDKQSSIRGKTY